MGSIAANRFLGARSEGGGPYRGTNLADMGIGPMIAGVARASVGGVGGLRWGMVAVFGFDLLGALQFVLVVRRHRRTSRPS